MDRDEELVDDSELCVKASDDGLVYHVRDIPHPQAGIDQLQVEEVWQRVDATGGRLLGRGGFGQVFKEQCMHDIRGTKVGRFRAVKVIERGNEVTKAYYREELKALAKFSNPKYHSWFVKCLGWYEAMDRIFITMEYLEHGDLQRYLSRQFSELESHRITSQVVKGLAFMHRYNFIHRDLKPANLLVVDKPPDKHWWVKISDFGISKRSTDGQQEYSTVNIGTQEYMAPEVRFFKRRHKDDKAAYTVAADMWALGELCVRLITGNPAFDLRELVEYYHYQQAFVPDDALVSHGVSQDARDFIRAVMAPDPQERLSADEATKHRWITLNHRPTPPVYGPVIPSKPSNASDPGLTDEYRATAQWDSGVFDVEQPAQDVTMRPAAAVRQVSGPAMLMRNPDAMPAPATRHPSNSGTQATEYYAERKPTAATELGKPRSNYPALSREETRRSGHIARLDPSSPFTLSTGLALRNAELAQPRSDPNGPRKDGPQRPMINDSDAPSGLRAKVASFLGLPSPKPIPSTPAGIPGVSPSRFKPRRPPPPPPPRATKPANYTPPQAASPVPREPYLPSSKPPTTAPGPTVSANHPAGPQVPIPTIRLSFITAQDQVKFEDLFKSTVGDGQATMSGELARGILIRSRLDEDSLYHIWTLADITRSGQLYFPEFCLAMYLCNLKRTGRSLPSTLPDNIKNEVSSMVDIINFSVPEEQGPFWAAPTLTPPAPTPLGLMNPQSMRGFEIQPAMRPHPLRPISDHIRLSQESLSTTTALSAFPKNQQMLEESVGNKERGTERPQTRRIPGSDSDWENLPPWTKRSPWTRLERDLPGYRSPDYADPEAERRRYQKAVKERASRAADVRAQERNEMEAQQKELFLNAGPQRGARTKKDAEEEALEQRLREAQEIERRQRELFRNSGPQKRDRKARVTPEEAAENKRLRDALQEEERQKELLRNSDPAKAQAQRQREAKEIERRQRELFLNSGPQKKKKTPRT